MAQSAGVALRSQFEPASIWGDAVLIERLIHNLIDNAIRYNLPRDGWVSITTQFDSRSQVCIVVENSGPVISSDEVPRLFEPFRRLSSTDRQAEVSAGLGRRGAGLGLSIVRAIVISHRGTMEAAARPKGGLVIRVNLSVRQT